MTGKINKRVLRALFKDITAWFKEKDWDLLSIDTYIFFDGKQYTAKGEYVKDRKASDVTEYADDKGLTMTFEGVMYEVINGEFPKLLESFDALFEKHGVYYQLGNSWNLTVFKG
jgi:hypothetical protein